MDVATFQATYPEFRTTEPRLVAAKLAMAARWVDPTVWGNRVDDGIGLFAAHLLKSIPSGTSTAKTKDRRTTYLDLFEELRAAIVGGFPGGGTWR